MGWKKVLTQTPPPGDIITTVAGDDGKILSYDHGTTSFAWITDSGGAVKAVVDTAGQIDMTLTGGGDLSANFDFANATNVAEGSLNASDSIPLYDASGTAYSKTTLADLAGFVDTDTNTTNTSTDFNTDTGVITLTDSDGNDVTVDIDGRHTVSATDLASGTIMVSNGGTGYNVSHVATLKHIVDSNTDYVQKLQIGGHEDGAIYLYKGVGGNTQTGKTLRIKTGVCTQDNTLTGPDKSGTIAIAEDTFQLDNGTEDSSNDLTTDTCIRTQDSVLNVDVASTAVEGTGGFQIDDGQLNVAYFKENSILLSQPTTFSGSAPITIGMTADNGADFKAYGSSAGSNMHWDASANKLIITGDIEVSGSGTSVYNSTLTVQDLMTNYGTNAAGDNWPDGGTDCGFTLAGNAVAALTDGIKCTMDLDGDIVASATQASLNVTHLFSTTFANNDVISQGLFASVKCASVILDSGAGVLWDADGTANAGRDGCLSWDGDDLWIYKS